MVENLSDRGAELAQFEGFIAGEGRMHRDQAHEILAKINKDFRGEPFDIPIEQYDEFLKAAKDYLTAVADLEKINPGSSKGDRMVRIAEDVVRKAPEEKKAVA